MALRIETRTGALLMGLAWAAVAGFGQETLRYEVWHGHSRVQSLPPHIKRTGNTGTLTISATGVAFTESYKNGKPPKHPHTWQWKFDDIQQLTVLPQQLKVLTYVDHRWKAGLDREYEFHLEAEGTFDAAYAFLKDRLDQRLVAGVAATPLAILWEVPAKHLTRFGGDHGTLQIGESEIVYKSAAKGESRVWRYADIDNISSSGPFQLSITTFERARLQYGSEKGFNFQLKQRLPEARFNDLWLRLNRARGLDVLTAYRQGARP